MPGIATGVGALVGGAASIYGAKKSSDASKEASQTEAQSAKDALDFLKQQLAIVQQQRQPYVNFGGGALGKLSDLLGIQNPATAGNTGPINPNIPQGPFTPNVPPGMSATEYQSLMAVANGPSTGLGGAAQKLARDKLTAAGVNWQGGTPTGSSKDFVGGAGRPDATVGGTAAPPMGMQPNANSGGTLASLLGGAGGNQPVVQSGTVTMIAPDGSRNTVPAALQTFYQAKGARLAS